MMCVEELRRPLSIDRVRDGGIYSLRAEPSVQTNLFFKVRRVDDVFLKAPSARGLQDYRHFVKRGLSTREDVRPLAHVERFEQLEVMLERFPEFRRLKKVKAEILHYLVVHKVQYERLSDERTLNVPRARFGMLRSNRFFRRFEPALFQERIPGPTLWEMFDFAALAIHSRWRPFLPAIAEQLSRIFDSNVVNHIDWNIRNFVFHESDQRLYYVDLKPTTFIATRGNEHNVRGLRKYFIG
jgi:hypothetical protein